MNNLKLLKERQENLKKLRQNQIKNEKVLFNLRDEIEIKEKELNEAFSVLKTANKCIEEKPKLLNKKAILDAVATVCASLTIMIIIIFINLSVPLTPLVALLCGGFTMMPIIKSKEIKNKLSSFIYKYAELTKETSEKEIEDLPKEIEFLNNKYDILNKENIKISNDIECLLKEIINEKFDKVSTKDKIVELFLKNPEIYELLILGEDTKVEENNINIQKIKK